MELNELTETTHRKGKDNQGFDSEEHSQISIDVENALEDPESTFDKVDNKRFLEQKIEALRDYVAEHKKKIKMITILLLVTGEVIVSSFYTIAGQQMLECVQFTQSSIPDKISGVIAMVIAACIINFQRATGLLVITVVTGFFVAWDWAVAHYGDQVWEGLLPVRKVLSGNWRWIRWVMCVLLVAGVVCWLVLDTAKQGTRQLVSFAGLLSFIFLMLLFSNNPRRVSWRTVLSGVGLQFVFGLLILRTTVGFTAVDWLGKQVTIFLSYTDAGSKFVFGESYEDHFFAFKVLPIIVFFCTVITMLYYVGFMSWLIPKVGFIMQLTMGTSPMESMAAAGNIFLGQTESPLLIRPYISQLTLSEMHAVMTGGLASIAGSVLGAFIAFGIAGSHLLTASVMSAPASLAIAKLFWPETETPRITASKDLKLAKSDCKNLLEAASYGASSAVVLVANVAVSLIAFIALLAFADAALSWLGGMFDYPQLSFSVICSYVFMPVSFMMGVSWEDSFIVGELIGRKTFFNEFVAYQKLADYIKLRKAGGPEYVDNVKQYISVHSETIATYALCGFANFASLGMLIGGLSAMAPDRRSDISRCGMRALISGTVACFMTACIAGVLYVPPLHCEQFLNTLFNHTDVANSTELATCCAELYNSVTVSEQWNVMVTGGFNTDALHGCCTTIPPTHFNCSLVL